MQLHNINITETGAKCSCGWKVETKTGGEAARAAWNHGHHNKPGGTRDLRKEKSLG